LTTHLLDRCKRDEVAASDVLQLQPSAAKLGTQSGGLDLVREDDFARLLEGHEGVFICNFS